jgi:hypothetical protein
MSVNSSSLLFRHGAPWVAVGVFCLVTMVQSGDQMIHRPSPPSPGSESALAPPSTLSWVRPGINTNSLTWGIQGGLLWGLPRPSGKSTDAPRGLIRLYYPVLENDGYDLLNFIAIEPVVNGRKGFSELERSQLDDLPGKRLWVPQPPDSTTDPTRLPAGELVHLPDGTQRLSLTLRVERFQNGAHVTLTVTQRSDTPDEIQLTIEAEPDSATMEYCILTATMGNKARTRHLWLKDDVVSSLELYPDYRDPDFTPHRFFALDRLHRTPGGDALAAITTDEANPALAPPTAAAAHWRYLGTPVTQYWRKPADTCQPDLHVAVNARYTYWMSRHPIPGGVAFENFEMRERFHNGQTFSFGITRRPPAGLGFPN